MRRDLPEGVHLVPLPPGPRPRPSWLDLVTIEWPEAAELDGKQFQRKTAMELVFWAVDTNRDQTKLPPPYTALRPTPRAAHPAAVESKPAPAPPAPPPRIAGRIVPEPATPAGAAAALRAVLDKEVPAPGTVMECHMDGRPKWWWYFRYPDLPGLRRIHEGSTRSEKVEVTYTHDLLSGWVYAPDELREMVDDLQAIADGKGQPTMPTRGPGSKPPPKAQAKATAQGSLL